MDRLPLALQRAERRLAAAHRDADRVSRAPELLYEAELLKSARAPRYAEAVEVMDYAQDPPQKRRITLTPGTPLPEQIARRFREARRLARAEEKVLQRIHEVEQQIALLRVAIANGALTPQVEALLPAPQKPKQESPEPELPYRIYEASTARAIWVGKGASKNDALTFKHASPHAQWLHATGFAGAHVVVPKRRGEILDAATLDDAARLAAHFSKAPPGFVEVAITEVKFVRKPRGAKPGAVILSRESQRRIDNDPEKIKMLTHRRAPPRVAL
jgi:predicted ribosome quality control (RQC) complex YloA/Tae2 family protein